MKKILVITGSRGEWGYLRPVLEKLDKEPSLEFSILATNMQVLSGFGNSYKEIEKDGFPVKYKIPMSYEGDNYFSHLKSLGSFLTSLGDILFSESYDFILLAGDRGEQLMGAIAGAYTYIPTLHIQAGELSGNIDGAARHAIGKLAHIHSASNIDAEKRLLSTGEQPFRVYTTGAPQIDDMLLPLESVSVVKTRLNIEEGKYCLVVLHPITEDLKNLDQYVDEFMQALKEVDLIKIFILPNNDVGSELIKEKINGHDLSHAYFFKNLSRSDYLSILNESKFIIGNSSSGILEAPTYQVPCINIGGRQHKRYQGSNVINCDFKKDSVLNAISLVLDDNFKEKMLAGDQFPYGLGDSSQQIVEIFKTIQVNRKLLVKELTV